MTNLQHEKEKFQLDETQIEPVSLENGISSVVTLLKTLDPDIRIRIISHHDADGLTAAGLMARAFIRLKLRFHISIIRALDDDFINQLTVEKNWDVLIFTDLGSSKLESLAKISKDRPVIILDHHEIVSQSTPPGLTFFNPHLYGIDGSSELSGAGTAYFICSTLDPKNKDGSIYAIIGALGDRQDSGKQGAFEGINNQIVQAAKDLSLLSDNVDFSVFGSQTRPLLRVLENLDFVSLDNVVKLLDELQIQVVDGNRPRTLANLSAEEKKRLVNTLITQYDADVQQIIRKVYILEKEPKNTFLRDAREFSSMLNSLGRRGSADVAIALVLGERRKSPQLAQKIYKEYRAQLSSALTFASDHINDLGPLLYLDGRNKIDETIIGTIGSILVSKGLTKPLIGVAVTNDGKRLKLSLRIPKNIDSQIDAASMLRDSLALIAPQSEVGGHKGAAGAIILPEVLDKLLNELAEQF